MRYRRTGCENGDAELCGYGAEAENRDIEPVTVAAEAAEESRMGQNVEES